MSSSTDRVELEILVVDDEPAVLDTIADYLEARDHRVHRAHNGEAGLEVIAKHALDIVITDIQMPGADGFALLDEVRQKSPDTEVIMITAFGDVERAVEAMRRGAFDFFTKPLKMRDIGTALQRTVRFQALQRENRRYRERLVEVDSEAEARYGLESIVGESAADGPSKRAHRPGGADRGDHGAGQR